MNKVTYIPNIMNYKEITLETLLKFNEPIQLKYYYITGIRCIPCEMNEGLDKVFAKANEGDLESIRFILDNAIRIEYEKENAFLSFIESLFNKLKNKEVIDD